MAFHGGQPRGISRARAGAGYCLKRSELTGAPPTRQTEVGWRTISSRSWPACRCRQEPSTARIAFCRDSDLPFSAFPFFVFFREPLSSSRRPAAVLGRTDQRLGGAVERGRRAESVAAAAGFAPSIPATVRSRETAARASWPRPVSAAAGERIQHQISRVAARADDSGPAVARAFDSRASRLRSLNVPQTRGKYHVFSSG